MISVHCFSNRWVLGLCVLEALEPRAKKDMPQVPGECEIQCMHVELLINVLLLGHPRLLLLEKALWLNKEVSFERWDGH